MSTRMETHKEIIHTMEYYIPVKKDVHMNMNMHEHG